MTELPKSRRDVRLANTFKSSIEDFRELRFRDTNPLALSGLTEAEFTNGTEHKSSEIGFDFEIVRIGKAEIGKKVATASDHPSDLLIYIARPNDPVPLAGYAKMGIISKGRARLMVDVMGPNKDGSFGQ